MYVDCCVKSSVKIISNKEKVVEFKGTANRQKHLN